MSVPASRRILLAEDDEDDHTLITLALEGLDLGVEVAWVQDGEEVLAYLHQEGAYAPPAEAPRPDLILLDLNMPRMDGREVLEHLRRDGDLATLPVVVLTTSNAERDVEHCYRLGANAYVQKPMDFEGLVSMLGVVVAHWFDAVTLPPAPGGPRLLHD